LFAKLYTPYKTWMKALGQEWSWTRTCWSRQRVRRQGASFALVSSIPAVDFQPCLSVGLYGEWQEVLTRPENLVPGRTVDDALGFVRYLASQSHLQQIHFLWRPFLHDPDDDMVLELAFAAGCRYIVTHNVRHYEGSEQLGVRAVTPREFVDIIRKKP
jgi:predicted nucleic acid-binding protein